jgi:lactose/L-arabinose transport system substrate-binding protein
MRSKQRRSNAGVAKISRRGALAKLGRIGLGLLGTSAILGDLAAPPVNAASASSSIVPKFSASEIKALMDNTPHPDVRAKLTLWGYYNGPVRAVAKQFQALYPNVQFDIHDFGQGDNHTRLEAAFAAGTGAPDIAMIQDEFVATVWGSDGGLLEVTDRLKPYVQYFPKQAVVKVSDPQGHTWGVPWDLGPALLWYRSDVFDRYGIKADAIQTWDDYIAAGKQVIGKSGGKVKMLISNQILNPGGAFIVLSQDQSMLSQQLGSGWWDDSGSPTLDNAANIRAMKMVKRFRDEKISANDLTGDGEIATIKKGTVATYPHAAWFQLIPKSVAPDTSGKWGFMTLPAFDRGGVRASNVGGTAFYITKQSKNPEVAWAFLKYFLLRPDARALSYKTGNLFEVFLPAYQSEPIFTAPDKFFNGKNPNQLALEVMIRTPPVREARGHKAARAIFDEHVGDMLSGKVSVESGMKEINRLIKLKVK